MEFIYPSFLWALLTLIVPIILHLFYFRRYKKVYFSNVKLLKELKEETSTSNRIKDLLILLSRLFALAALVFAFAQPYLPQGREIKKGNSAVSIFIDNSFSMHAEKDEVPLLEIAKAKARQIISAYTEQDRFQIITQDFEGRHQRLISKETALSYIDEVNISPQARSLNQIIFRQKEAVNRAEDNEVLYLLSDFQSSMMTNNIEQDTTVNINFLPLSSVQQNNVAIDSVWLPALVPIINQNNQLVVQITNYGTVDDEGIRLTSLYNNQEKPEGTFDIPAGETVKDTVNININKTGDQNITLKITDYPIQYDDAYYVNLYVPESIEVLAIYDVSQSTYLNALFEGVNFYNFSNQRSDAVDYGRLSVYDLIILNDLRQLSSGLASQLDKYVTGGGNLLIFPSQDANVSDYNNLLNALGVDKLKEKNTSSNEVKYINTEEFIFTNVYEYVSRNISLPSVNQYYTISNFQNRGKESIMKFRDGATYLAKYSRSGNVYLFTSPLNVKYNDLAKKAEVFVPMIYKMSIAKNEGQKIDYTIGSNRLIEVEKSSNADIVYKIVGEEEFIPSQKNIGDRMLLDVQNQITNAGFYTIVLDDTNIRQVAFNFDRKESDPSTLSQEKLDQYSSELGAEILNSDIKDDFVEYVAEKDRGVSLWKWFLIAALAFLAIEILLVKLFKNS